METRFPLDHGYLNCKTIGERAEFFLEVAGQDQGLYRGCLLGKNGHLDLGTLIPEGGKLRLRRSLPLSKLRQHNCWPVTGARVVLSHPFSQTPNGWTALPPRHDLFPQDPLLAQALQTTSGGLICPLPDGTFRLAFPFLIRCPFPLVPLFCFAQIQTIRNRSYAVFHLKDTGQPLLPAASS